MGEGFLDIVKARDISEGGVGVWIPHGFSGCNIESYVELVVTLPGRKPFMVTGSVKHDSENKAGERFFGIEFAKLSPKHCARIRSFVTRRAEEEPGSVK